ncbi:RNA polymerase sigma-70 factor (ECF subfamily) [Thermoflavifilum aggregans]|uniref:RNA polymerase sigma-70 factor (ECF subfamily) n=1 Tax=Thermoflavifilum aggregans TaxID=454188 RepID=A0A2M9CUX2_9BACT|nr:RNA polymerase sigma-70 factor [Thermoflavifilum aggregans]PJJ75712.1 RNA polymerase sigma-70 factor (ECF subfamily) [Thermoflavifilum aggregans]
MACPANILSLWQHMNDEEGEKAYRMIFDYYYDRLLRFAICYVSVREEAEEIVLDVFLNIWLHRERLRKIKSPDTYLFISVRNRCLNYLRHFSHLHVRSVDNQQSGLELADRTDPQKEMERKQLHRVLDEAIAQLPFQCRMVFRLIREERMTYKEVAEILQISVRTVETQIQRAMQKLRASLHEQMSEFKARK